VGADAVAILADRHGGRLRGVRAVRASVGEVRVGAARVALAVPTTYMNESGNAAGALVRRYGIDDLSRLVIVHDELDLPPGRVRIKVGGGTAGHYGLRSVQEHLHDPAFVRVRIGIGKPPSAAAGAAYVLRRPPKAQRALLDTALEAAASAVEAVAEEGVEAAMNRFNG
jgi:PTH1 family peptidyl-tRNA hydrolase